MFSSDSQFGYSLLDQNDQRKEQMDLQNLEKQYLQNIACLRERMAELERQIEMCKVINDGYRVYELELNAKLFNVYQEMSIFNPNKPPPEIAHYKEALRQINLSILYAVNTYTKILTSYDEAQGDLDEQEVGLAKTKLKLDQLQPEVITEEEQVGTYQPPRP